MGFKLKISKPANQFFFVSNLSEWHFSCRKQYNQIWRAMLPSFTKEQDEALQLFKKVLQKYEKEEGDVAFPLFLKIIERRNIGSITGIMKRDEKEIVRRACGLFQPAFHQIWNEGEPRLRRFISLIKEPQYRNKIKEAFKIIEVYFGKPKCRDITVYLLIAPQNQWGGGGGNVGPDRLTAEIGDISPLGLDWISKVLIHELAHKCYQAGFKKLLKTFVKSLPPRSYKNFATVKFFEELGTVLSELITSSIVEEGVVDRLIFKFSSEGQLKRNIASMDLAKSSLSTLLRKSAVLALYPLNSRYLENKKSIDLEYIKHSFKFLKKFEAEYKKGRIKELIFL